MICKSEQQNTNKKTMKVNIKTQHHSTAIHHLRRMGKYSSQLALINQIKKKVHCLGQFGDHVSSTAAQKIDPKNLLLKI